MLKLAFVLSGKDAKNGLSMDDIPLEKEKYVRLPYYRVTLDNVEEYIKKSKRKQDEGQLLTTEESEKE